MESFPVANCCYLANVAAVHVTGECEALLCLIAAGGFTEGAGARNEDAARPPAKGEAEDSLPAGELDRKKILIIDVPEIARNWSKLQARTRTGAVCAAVLSRDAFGLGVEHIAPALHTEGCRNFFVSSTLEGRHIMSVLGPQRSACVFVYNGVHSHEEAAVCKSSYLTPVLTSTQQLDLWHSFLSAVQHSSILPPPVAIEVDLRNGILGLSEEEFFTYFFDSLSQGSSEETGDNKNAGDPTRFLIIRPLLILTRVGAVCPPSDLEVERRTFTEFSEKVRERVHHIGRTVIMSMPRFSFADSSTFYLGENAHLDMVRVGLALYGVNKKSNFFKPPSATEQAPAERPPPTPAQELLLPGTAEANPWDSDGDEDEESDPDSLLRTQPQHELMQSGVIEQSDSFKIKHQDPNASPSSSPKSKANASPSGSPKNKANASPSSNAAAEPNGAAPSESGKSATIAPSQLLRPLLHPVLRCRLPVMQRKVVRGTTPGAPSRCILLTAGGFADGIITRHITALYAGHVVTVASPPLLDVTMFDATHVPPSCTSPFIEICLEGQSFGSNVSDNEYDERVRQILVSLGHHYERRYINGSAPFGARNDNKDDQSNMPAESEASGIRPHARLKPTWDAGSQGGSSSISMTGFEASATIALHAEVVEVAETTETASCDEKFPALGFCESMTSQRRRLAALGEDLLNTIPLFDSPVVTPK
eukprot:gene11997-18531_t